MSRKKSKKVRAKTSFVLHHRVTAAAPAVVDDIALGINIKQNAAQTRKRRKKIIYTYIYKLNEEREQRNSYIIINAKRDKIKQSHYFWLSFDYICSRRALYI